MVCIVSDELVELMYPLTTLRVDFYIFSLNIIYVMYFMPSFLNYIAKLNYVLGRAFHSH